MDFGTLVKDLGFPIAVATFFVWRDYQSSKEHKQDLKDIALKSVQAIDAGTEAVRDSISVIDKNTDALGNNSNIISRIEGILSNRGNQNDNRGN